MKELTPQENTVPTEIKMNGEIMSASKAIAAEYGIIFDEKMKSMRKNVSHHNFTAMKVFNEKIKRIEEEAELKPLIIKETRKLIRSLKNTKARGESEMTNKIMKTLIYYMCLALTHLGNQMLRTGLFHLCLKCSRILPLKKY